MDHIDEKYLSPTAIIDSDHGEIIKHARIVIGVTNPFMRLTSGFHVSQALPTERGLDLMISRGRGDG